MRAFIFALCLSLCFVPFFSVAQASGVPPTILTYQGRLTDSGGNLLGGAGTNYYMKFSIWDSPTVGAGNRVWPTGTPGTTTVSVTQGVFTVNIGDTANGYPDALNLNFANNSTLYLQVEVSSDNVSSETLSPRQQLTSAVFAQIAGAIVGTTTASLFGTTTPVSSSFVTVQATSSNTVPLSIAGASSQSANLFQILSNTLSSLFSVSSSGGVTSAGLGNFNGGFISAASSTIGNGTAAGGLTVSGNATTTGTTYFGGEMGVFGQPVSGEAAHFYSASQFSAVHVALERLDNSQSAFLEFYPHGTLSSSNVEWLMGMNNNTDNYSFSYWNGSFTTEAMTVANNGNVGISTTTPGSLFSVGNTNGINFSTATSTFNATGGINLKSGCFAVNGSCISGGTGSLAFSYPFPSNATSTALTFSGGLLSTASTTIGDGTAAGGLTVSGNATITGDANVSGSLNIGSGASEALFDLASSGTNLMHVRSTDASQYSEIDLMNNQDSAGLHSLVFGYTGSSYAGFGGLSGEFGYFGTNGAYPFGIFTNGTIHMVMDMSGHVGLGTTSPGSILSVSGVANFTTATSTFYSTGGINLAGGCFAVNGSCISGGPGGSGTVGSGTAGQVPYYAGSGTTLTATSSLFLTTGGMVGVGTTTPTHALSVAASGSADAALDISNTNASTYTAIKYMGTGDTWYAGVGNAGETGYGVANKYFIFDQTANSIRLAIDSSGNVGIGTASPASTLAVSGGATIGADYNTAAPANSLLVEGTVGIGTTTPGTNNAALTVAGAADGSTFTAISLNDMNNAGGQEWQLYSTDDVFAQGSGRLIFYRAWADGLGATMTLDPSGLVGIGTTGPMWNLQVSGTQPSIAISDTSAGADLHNWLLSSEGGNLYFSQAADSGATSTAALGIASNGDLTYGGSIFTFSNPATTTIKNLAQSWTLATSTTAAYQGVLSVSGNGATSTVSLFGATTTALKAGVGARVSSANQNLLIVGSGKTQANIAVVKGSICVDSDGWCSATTTGKVVASAGFTTASSDVAEMYTSSDALEPGDVVASTGGISIAKAGAATSGRVLGVVSTAPGLTLGIGPDDTSSDKYPVALSGRVPVKVNLDNGPIAQGDDLTLSNTAPGIAMKARPGDPVIGFALEPYAAASTTDTILAFVNRQTPQAQSDLFQNAAKTFTDLTSALSELASQAFESALQETKAMVGELVAKTAIIGDLFANHLFAKQADIGTADQPAGVTLFDTATHQPYCLTITNGSPTAVPGVCGTASASPADTGGATSTATTSQTNTAPPTITLLGANPAHLHVGDTFSDPGATAQDSLGHDLSVHTFLNGVAMNPIQVDTSTSTVYEIEYNATDGDGNTATTTRSVVVR